MKKTSVIIALLSLSLNLSAQKHELTYQSYTKDVAKQDTSLTIIYRNQDEISIQGNEDLMQFNPIQGLAHETLYINYATKNLYRQLEYQNSEAYLATSTIPDNTLEIEGEEEVNGYKCKKYRTSINSNTIELWVTEDLKMNATPILQFANLPGVLIKFQRNGSSITELSTIKSLNKKAKINTQPLANATQVTFRELDQIEKDKKVITTHIFNKERIHWGDTTKYQSSMPFDTTIHFAGGTLILKRINLQVLPEHYQIFAELTTQSSGDAYDRTGSIFIIPQDSITFYDALTKGIDAVPYFTSKKGSKYQGMTATPHYSPVVELIRFFTPFGVGHFNDRVQIDGLEWQEEVYYKQEITDLKPFLQGDVLIGAFIGNYDGGGHLLSLDLKAYPGDYVNLITPQRQWTLPLFNTCNVMEMAGQNYPHFFDTDTLSVTFEIPEGVNKLKLRYISTGHGGWGGGDEFNPKPNNIIIDDTIIYQYTPWREDCGRYREWNPVSGNFWNGLSSSDLSRSGWCPGTATQPTYIFLDNLEPGRHTIKVAIPQGQAEGGSFSSWNVSGVLIGE
ncbi:MAG: PNGase F N-terminal domain-containing protein [Bacteroidales bacterium]|nr:PNGase F N-terminal domain-containing protein [Bacteroidales bacterium]